MSTFRRVLAFVAVLALAACSTKISVRKVCENDQETPGIRYSLPQRMLTVTPSADGGVTGAWNLLPDAANTYAIEAHSVMASHKLDVTVAEGLLTGLTYNPDATMVAKQTADSAGATTKALLDERSKTLEAEAKAAQEVQKARDTLDAEVARVEKELAIANAKLMAQLDEGDKPENVRATRIEIAELEAELIVARQRLSEFGTTRLAKRSAQDSEKGKAGRRETRGTAFPRVQGPVNYRIEEKVDSCGRTVSCRLVPVLGPGHVPQKAWETSEVPPARGKVTKTGPAASFALTVEGGPAPVLPLASRIQAARKRLAAVTARRSALEKAARVDLVVLSNEILAESDARIAYEDAHQPILSLTANRSVMAVQSVKVKARPAELSPAWNAYLERPTSWKLVTPTRLELTLPPELQVGEETAPLRDGRYKVKLMVKPAPVAGDAKPGLKPKDVAFTVKQKKPEPPAGR